MNDNLHFVYIIILIIIIIYFNNRISNLENNSIEKFANTCNEDVTFSKGLTVTNTLNAKGNLSVDGTLFAKSNLSVDSTLIANGGVIVKGQLRCISDSGNTLQLEGGDASNRNKWMINAIGNLNKDLVFYSDLSGWKPNIYFHNNGDLSCAGTVNSSSINVHDYTGNAFIFGSHKTDGTKNSWIFNTYPSGNYFSIKQNNGTGWGNSLFCLDNNGNMYIKGTLHQNATMPSGS